MRLSQKEKMEIIRLVEQSPYGVKKTLKELGINRSTFYIWYGKYTEGGYDALAQKRPERKGYWNQIPDEVRQQIVNLALALTDQSPREIAIHYTNRYRYYVSESSVYRILKERGLIAPPVYNVEKAADEYHTKTSRPDEMWQTDFTYFKVLGWGWYYLSTILDDYGRFIVAWKLCKTMKREDVEDTVNQALLKYNIPRGHRPKLLSDNGSCYIASDLRAFLGKRGIKHIRGAANHPQTQGKVERYQGSMKSLLLLDNYTSPRQLEEAIAKWVEYYNYKRPHESLNNLTPADVYFGRAEQKLKEREDIYRKTMKERRRIYEQQKLAL